MGNQRTSGLTKRGGIWHIDKTFRGARICESTGTGDLGRAEEYLAKRLIELREISIYGARQKRSFRVAATKYLQENAHKKRVKDDALHLKLLDGFIGDLELHQVHMGNLELTRFSGHPTVSNGGVRDGNQECPVYAGV